MRRFSENVAVATVALDEPGPGLYLVEAADGAELVEILAVADGLCMARDGRGFPLGRAHYVYAIVQLVAGDTGPALDETTPGPGDLPAQEGDENDGHAADQD